MRHNKYENEGFLVVYKQGDLIIHSKIPIGKYNDKFNELKEQNGLKDNPIVNIIRVLNVNLDSCYWEFKQSLYNKRPEFESINIKLYSVDLPQLVD